MGETFSELCESNDNGITHGQPGGGYSAAVTSKVSARRRLPLAIGSASRHLSGCEIMERTAGAARRLSAP